MIGSQGFPRPAPSLWLGLRRERALGRAIRRRLARRWLLRLSRFGGWYVAVGHAALGIWLLGGEGGMNGSVLYVRALGYLTVIAAIAAAGTAIDLAAFEREEGLDALCRLKGFTGSERAGARFFATTALVMSTLLGPAIVLGLVFIGLSQSFADVVARCLRLLAAVAYAPLAALLLAALGRWSVLLAPRRSRTLLLALLVVPHLVYVTTGHGPSVIAFLSDLLDRIEALAGGIG